jgi:hypothetical protein
VPAGTVTVSPDDAASMAAWMVVKGCTSFSSTGLPAKEPSWGTGSSRGPAQENDRHTRGVTRGRAMGGSEE